MSNKRDLNQPEDVEDIRPLKPSELESLKGGALPGPDRGSHAPQPRSPSTTGERPNE